MAKRRKGRPPKTAAQKQADKLARSEAPQYILDRRKLFSFVQPPSDKRLDGRNGEIDSEICDAIGQLCALGLFDGHGHDPVEMRDKGRFWGCHYAKLMKPLSVRTGRYERRDRSEASGAITAADLLFDKMDACLPSRERQVLLTLLVEPLIGYGETVDWAQALIDEALRERGRFQRLSRFPDLEDRERLKDAIRGLNCLIDGALPARYERRAA